MNKKVIAFNVLLLIAVLLLIELLSFFIVFVSIGKEFICEKKYRDVQNWFSINNMHLAEDYVNFRPVSNPKNFSEKKPVVLLGCSYTYGTTLNDNETFAQQLSDYTGRKVYNLGIQSMGTSSALYFLEKNDIKTKIPEAEYFIYLFIYDHIRRIYLNMPNIVYNYFGANYKLDKHGKLKFNKLNKIQMFFHSFYLNRLIDKFISERQITRGDFSLFRAILMQLNNTIQEKYPEAKLVMIVYDDEPCYDETGKLITEKDENLSKICNDIGIQIIYTKQMHCGKDIMKRKYIASDGWHPSKEAWEKVVPEITTVMGL